MPSVTTNTYIETDTVSCLNVSTTDPRSDGAVDSALFDSTYLPIIRSYKWARRNGGFATEDGISFSAVMSKLVGLSYRLEDNEDFTANNYSKRVFLDEHRLKGLESLKRQALSRKLVYFNEFHPKTRWKSKLEWVEVPVICQKDEVVIVKVSTFCMHHVPKYGVLEDGHLYFRPRSDQINRGKSIAKHVLEALDLPCTGRRLSRSDLLDYRIDPITMFWYATQLNTLVYDKCGGGSIAVLQMWLHMCTGSWPMNVHAAILPNHADADDKDRLICVAIDSSVVDALEAKELVWSYKMEGDKIEIVASYFDTTWITLKKCLTGLYSIDTGPSTTGSRFSKNYDKAIESNNLSKRAMYENMVNSEKGRGRCLYTQARKTSYKHIHADKTVFVPEAMDGIGCFCIDMRSQSLRIGGLNHDC